MMRPLHLFFHEEEDDYQDLITSELGCSDKAWNMLSINTELHRYWSRPYWAVKCVSIMPLDQGPKQTLTMRFQWLRHSNGDPTRRINISTATDCYTMLDGLSTPAAEGGKCPGGEGFVTANCRPSNQPIASGQDFHVVLDTLEDATKMKKMLEIQWACITLAAMSGGAGPDNSDDTFSEFGFEKKAYERRCFYDFEDF